MSLFGTSYGAQKLADACKAGARGRDDALIDIMAVNRKKMAWYSPRIRDKLGIDPRPADGTICPLCQKPGKSFALDHQTPWRIYTAVFVEKTPGVTVTKGQILIPRQTAKALYNDPDNLWWICQACNSKKSDKIYDTADQLHEIEHGQVPDGQIVRGDDMFEVVIVDD